MLLYRYLGHFEGSDETFWNFMCICHFNGFRDISIFLNFSMYFACFGEYFGNFLGFEDILIILGISKVFESF